MAKKIIYWLPRILSIGFILFLSLFALDVFSEYSGWNAVLPLLIHLLPSLVLIGIVIVAWKYELAGAIAFLGFAVFYVCAAGLNRPWSWYASISGPSAVVGILFLVSWFQKKKSGM
ncbi:MAG: hypothetical protein WC475_00160 [Candidatus Paceibacterota bacterium]